MKLTPGQIITGQITGIQPYGAFVQIDAETTGLIHISELSDGFVKDIESVVKIGDRLTLKVLEIDPKTNHLKLSLKALKSTSRKSRPRSRLVLKPKDKLGFTPVKEALSAWIAEAKKELKL